MLSRVNVQIIYFLKVIKLITVTNYFLNKLIITIISPPGLSPPGLHSAAVTFLLFQSFSSLSNHGNAVGRALDLQSVGLGFKSYSRQHCVTTLGKLLTPMFLCYQAV